MFEVGVEALRKGPLGGEVTGNKFCAAVVYVSLHDLHPSAGAGFLEGPDLAEQEVPSDLYEPEELRVAVHVVGQGVVGVLHVGLRRALLVLRLVLALPLAPLLLLGRLVLGAGGPPAVRERLPVPLRQVEVPGVAQRLVVVPVHGEVVQKHPLQKLRALLLFV